MDLGVCLFDAGMYSRYIPAGSNCDEPSSRSNVNPLFPLAIYSDALDFQRHRVDQNQFSTLIKSGNEYHSCALAILMIDHRRFKTRLVANDIDVRSLTYDKRIR